MLILILTALFNYWGFAAGVLIMLLTAAGTKTATGRGYLYPLIPFHPKALLSLLVRQPISHRNS